MSKTLNLKRKSTSFLALGHSSPMSKYSNNYIRKLESEHKKKEKEMQGIVNLPFLVET